MLPATRHLSFIISIISITGLLMRSENHLQTKGRACQAGSGRQWPGPKPYKTNGSRLVAGERIRPWWLEAIYHLSFFIILIIGMVGFYDILRIPSTAALEAHLSFIIFIIFIMICHSHYLHHCKSGFSGPKEFERGGD